MKGSCAGGDVQEWVGGDGGVSYNLFDVSGREQRI